MCDGTATHDPARSCDWRQLETGRLAGIAVDVGRAYRSSAFSGTGRVSSERALYACGTDANFRPNMLRRRLPNH